MEFIKALPVSSGVKKFVSYVAFIHEFICRFMGTLHTFMMRLDVSVYAIVECALVAYRADQELASHTNPVFFRRCVVELG